MFKQNELRPGNYIQGAPFSITRLGIWGDGTSTLTAYGLYTLGETVNSKYTPIPISNEWLQSLGFKRVYDGVFEIFYKDIKSQINTEYKVFNSIQIFFDNSWLVATLGKTSPLTVIKEIKYVHELQNLYFYLVGDELTYL